MVNASKRTLLLVTCLVMFLVQTICSASESEGTQTKYPVSLQGVEDYMAAAETSEPDVHKKLQPDLQSLQTRDTTSQYVLIGSLVVGGGLLIYSTVRYFADFPVIYSYDSTSINSSAVVSHVSNYLIWGSISGAIAIGGVIAYAIISPGQQDFRNFFRKRNTVRDQKSSDSGQWEFGVRPDYDGVGLTLAFNF